MPSIQEIYAAINKAEERGDERSVEILSNLFERQRRANLGLPPLPTEEDGSAKKEKTDEEAGFLENVATGLGSGFVGTTATAALGAATVLEEDTELKARRKILDLQEDFTPEGGDKDSLTYKLASGVGSLGAFASTAILGKAALPAAGVLALGAGAGEASERARAYGASEEERNAASLRGAAIGTLELLPLGRLAKNLDIPGLPDFLEKLSGKVTPKTITGIRTRLQRMAGTGVSELTQEATAAILQNLNEAGYNPEQVMFDMGVVEEGAIGGGAGAIVQGVADVLNRKNLRADKTIKDEVDETQEEFDARQEKSRAGRGDTQPDMFSDELDDAEIAELDKKQDDEGDLAVELELEEALREEGPQQLDVEDAIADDKELEALFAEDDKKEELRKASEVETRSAKRDEEIQSKTKLGRRVILNEILDAAPEKGSNVRDVFRARLEEAGYRDPEPNAEETRTIKRFLDVKTAKLEELPDLPSDSDLSTLEAQVKEKKDAREQVTTTPDAETTGDSVPSSAGVVGVERTESAKESGRPKQGRLDDSERDTGRPAGREGEQFSPLTQKLYGILTKTDDAGRESGLGILKAKLPKAQYAELERLITRKDAEKATSALTQEKKSVIPTFNTRTKKFKYSGTGYKNFAKNLSRADKTRLRNIAKKAAPANTPAAVQEVVSTYMSFFASPEQAVYAAMNDKINPTAKIIQKAGSRIDEKDRATLELEQTFAGRPLQTELSFSTDKELLTALGKDSKKSVVIGEVVLDWVNNNLDPQTVKAIEGIAKAEKVTQKETEKQVRRVADVEKKAKDPASAKEAKETKKEKVRFVKKAKPKAKPKAKAKPKKDEKELAEISFNDSMDRKDLDLTKQSTYNSLLQTAQTSQNPKDNIARLVEATSKAKATKRKAEDTQKEVDQAVKDIDARKEQQKKTKKKKKDYKETNTADVVAKVKAKYKGLQDKQIIGALRKAEEAGGSTGASKRVAEYFDTATKEQIIEDAKEYTAGTYYRGLDYKDLKIDAKNIASLEGFVPATTLKLIEGGDLKGAVLDFAKTLSGQPASVARAMANNLGNAKVDMRTTEQLGGVVGGRVKQGQLDVGNNTVSYNSDIPLTGHALLHEVAHAVTNSGLNNKSLPATRQLTNIYNSVKKSLSGAYGTENVKEFVAEVMSNDKFRKELARLDIDGNNIPVLRLVFNAISNRLRALVGLSTKPIERFDMDNLDSLTMALVNTNLDRVGNDTIAMARTPNEILNLTVEIAKATDKYKGAIADNSWAASAYKFATETLPRKTREIYFKLHGGQSMGDMARAAGFGTLGLQLDKAITAQRGLQMDYEAKIEKVKKKYNKWARKNNKLKVILDSVIYNPEFGATIHQVDPTKPATAYSGEKLAIWKEQQKQWNKLDAEGKALFTEMRDSYKDMYKQLLDAINTQVDTIVDGDKQAAISIKKKLENKLLASGALDVYFPLVRQGDYRISFNAQLENSYEQVFMMFANKAERDAFAEELTNDKDVDSIETFEGDIDVSRYDNAPSSSFTNEVLEILNKANVGAGVQEEVLKLFIDKLPETSFAKAFRRRKKTMGYIHDAGYALETKGSSLAIQTAKIKSSAKIKAIEKQIEAKADELIKKDPDVREVRNVLRERAKFARSGAKNKETETIIKNFNQVAFLYTLGFNVSSAVVNLSQIPLVIVPFLSGRFGLSESMDAFTSAGSMLGGNANIKDYFDQEGTGYDSVFTLKPSEIKKIEDTAISKEQAAARIQQLKDLIPLIKEANANGQLYSMSFMDELGINEKSNLLDKVTHGSAIFFNAAERFNRQSTLIATYNLVRKQMVDKAKAGERYYSEFDGKFIAPKTSTAELRKFAAREALYLTQQTNGGAVLETAPRLTQEGWGRVAGMYKSFGLQMYYTLFKTYKIMMANKFAKTPEGKEQRNVAFKQLVGIHMSALFFAGVSGVPLYGIVSSLVDMFFLDDDEDDVDTIVRKAIKEGPFKGVVSEVLGADVASRIKLTDLIINENRFSNNESLEQGIGFYLGGPFLSTLNRFYRAAGDYSQENYHEMFEGILPPALGNVKKALRYSMDDGIKTRREDYVMRDLSTGELVGKAFGFAPTEYTFRQAKNARNKKVENAIIDEAKELREKFFQATRRSDSSAVKDVLKDIAEFNKDHPLAAISRDNLLQSVKRHFETSAKMVNGVTVNDKLRSDTERSNENWSRGF